jgi:hypothetical protein
MRRKVLLAILLLSGCSGSGFYRYERDSFSLPWNNPNAPVSSSENFMRARHGSASVQSSTLLTEAGDIWPGPPQPVPTLKELQKQQLSEINSEADNPGASLSALPPLPSLPGYELSQQEPSAPAPSRLFGGGVVVPHGHGVSTRYDSSSPILAPNATPSNAPATGDNGNILVPNGNGTSTVISPTGKVTTVPTPK